MAKPDQRVDRALLIGIDRYQYLSPQLDGCVGDVAKVSELLTKHLHTPADKVRILTAKAEGSEAAADLATRDNIIQAFLHLAESAGAGEQVYIQYSGHGMRNDSTLLPGLEADGRDEAIAPTDSGYQDPAAFYILDKELGWLIHRITAKGAFVTVVMDCCHSASSTRALGAPKARRGMRKERDAAGTRGWEGGDPRPRPDTTLVAPLADLKALVTGPGGTGSLLPAPKNYVLMTACRENETAKEFGTNGVFTHFMLEVLNGGFSSLTYRSLADRAGSSILKLAATNSSYLDQMPQLEGLGNLVVFGGGAIAEPRALTATPLQDGRIKISGGSAVGLVTGSVLALYPPGAVDLEDPNKQVALVTLTEVGPDSSIGKVADGVSPDTLQVGMRAVVIRPGSAKVRRRVALDGGKELDALKNAIETGGRDKKGSPYVELVAIGDQPELSVAVEGGDYIIRDERYVQGTRDQPRPLPRINPPVAAGGEGEAAAAAARAILQRLEHVIQYRNAWELHNADETSGLRDKLAISVDRQVSRGAGHVALKPGEHVKIRVHNRSGRSLSAALLYFGPDWSISRVWPDGDDPAYSQLASNGEEGLPVFEPEVALPPGVKESTERLKLFATDKPTSFDALMLGSLDQSRSVKRSIGANPLEDLLADIGEGRTTRELIRRTGTGDWSTAELEMDTTA